MAKGLNEKLPRREREILEVLFALGGEASAEEVREKLVDPPSYSAVRALLARMEAKNVVKHREQGLRYVYAPVLAQKAARRSALQRMVSVFFGGSSSAAVTALLREETWSPEELDEMMNEIQRVRNEGGRA
ncbi:MAG TPA: BlaI/MecI/CopY family transcriptional regulator [Thermoanaerobaculia bacterium]